MTLLLPSSLGALRFPPRSLGLPGLRSAVLLLTLCFDASTVTKAQDAAAPAILGKTMPPEAAYEHLRVIAANVADFTTGDGAPRVKLVGSLLTYDLRPLAAADVTLRPDRLTSPLEILIRCAVLQRDLAQTFRGGASFWDDPLASAGAQTMEMVRIAYRTNLDGEWQALQRTEEAKAEAQFAVLEKGIVAEAEKAKWQVATSRGGRMDGVQVDVEIGPPVSKVHYMRYLDFMRAQKFSIPLADLWLDLTQGRRRLIGRYWYRAEWPAKLEDGSFEVRPGSTRVSLKP